MVKFVRLPKHKIRKLNEVPSLELTAGDILEAEVLWVKMSIDRKLDTWKEQLEFLLGKMGCTEVKVD